MGQCSSIKQLLVLLLVATSTAQATITATNRGTGSDNSSVTSINVFTAGFGGMSAGSTGLLFLSFDNANAATSNFASSYTDSKGNVWYLRGDGTSGLANANAEGAILTAQITSSITNSDTLTITLAAATTAKVWAFIEVAPSVGNMAMPGNGIISTVSTTNLPSVVAGQASVNELLIGAVFAETDSANTWTADTDTTGGPAWSTAQTVAVGTTTSGVSLITQWKIPTAYGFVTYDPTLTSSADVRTGQIQLRESDPKLRAVGGSGTGGETAATVPVNLPVAANSIGVLIIGIDNNGVGGSAALFPTPISDNKSNSWTLRHDWIFDNGAAAQGAEAGVYTCVITTPLVPGDTITAGPFLASATAGQKGWVLWEFAPTGAGSMSYVTGASTGTGLTSTTSTPTITTSSIASGDYVIGVLAAEGNTGTEDNIVGATDATNGTWSAQASRTGGAALSAMATASQWKKVTAAGTQLYNPTQAAGNDTILGWLEINDSSPSGLTAAQKAAFFQLFR
jgi:hypothetical protein